MSLLNTSIPKILRLSWIKGRYMEENLPWNYREEILRYLKPELQSLDIDTGGSELFLSLILPCVICRVLKPGGLFITQRMETGNDQELVEILCSQTDLPFLDQYLKIAIDWFSQTGFGIQAGRTSG